MRSVSKAEQPFPQPRFMLRTIQFSVCISGCAPYTIYSRVRRVFTAPGKLSGDTHMLENPFASAVAAESELVMLSV